MGKKYIIELEDKPFHNGNGDFLYRVKGFNSLVFDMTGVGKLTRYTEPDLEQVREEAYIAGHDAGYGRKIDASYQEGIADTWEAARKIVCEMDCEDRIKIFGGVNFDYIFALSPTTVIDKLKAYEQNEEMDGLRQNIQTIVDKCGYTLDEIAAVLKEMKEGE